MKCAYCGLQNVVGLDEESKEDVRKWGDEHRKKIVQNLKAFSIQTYSYAIVDGKVQAEAPVRLVLADAADCLNRLVWSKDSYAQGFDGGTRRMKIGYTFNGEERESEFDIVLPKTEEFWRFGIALDENNLTLNVRLGSEEAHTKAENIDLRLT
jgi:hypothetical protein